MLSGMAIIPDQTTHPNEIFKTDASSRSFFMPFIPRFEPVCESTVVVTNQLRAEDGFRKNRVQIRM